MNPTDYQVDLTSCDREPIHQLGRIQDFGALIAVTSDWNIAFRSTNCDAILQPRKPVAIGDRLHDHFGDEALRKLGALAALAGERNVVERVFGIDLLESGRQFDAAVHTSGRLIVIEIEPASDTGMAHHAGLLRPLMDELAEARDTESLCDRAASQLKQLLGFDRVMVYRFHPDESGEVVAEAREPHLEAFHGLRYPKTDIPQQARRLYRKNLFRIISDVNADPIAIEPATDMDGEPLDLSQSTLRAVSPIHIEYLRNMGVGASLSISIIIGGKLWGLFACHHYARKVLPHPQRTLAELFSQLFSARLELSIMTAGNALKERAGKLHDRLMAQLVDGSSLSDNLLAIDEAIGTLIPHDGLSAFIDGEYRSRGAAPSEEEFRALVSTLNTASSGRIVHSDALVEKIPAASAFENRVVGALFIPVSRRPRDYVALWRKELRQTVTWAGNPEKPTETGPNGDRLTPRKSFAAWRESVRGRSASWREEELAIAEGLRVTLLEVILRITDETMQQRKRAQERQELLIAELNHRVRNILTLIRSLIGQSRHDAKDINQFADVIGGRIRALAMAHDQITREQWSPSSLHGLIRAEAEAYLTGKADRVLIEGPDALVTPEAFTVIALVIHEMMTNSAKYGSLCDSSGTLRIACSFNAHGDYVLSWRERGGPPVKAPTRRGFGSTIIEQSIPFELKGSADVRYELSGLEADFCIPSRLVSHNAGKKDASSRPADGDSRSPAERSAAEPGGLGEPVLLVEDSMIIALDAEELLRKLGFDDVRVANGVESALDEIAAARPRFALLDYNLGDDNSERVADRLVELDIPFWFVTGYGNAVDKLSGNKARGVLQKPYSEEDLQEAIATLGDRSATQDPR